MPHECTNCGRTFEDGSKEMLSGCPNCGGKKFQFRPAGSADPDESTGTEPTDPSEDASTVPDPSAAVETTDQGATESRSDREPESDPVTEATDTATPEAGDSVSDPDPDAGTSDATPEDTAQASARSDVVSPDEIAAGAGDAPETPEDDPDIETLRAELNEQFESIRILNPGQYELNLMELYDREEYIISLREDGRYVIEMPEGWGPRDDE